MGYKSHIPFLGIIYNIFSYREKYIIYSYTEWGLYIIYSFLTQNFLEYIIYFLPGTRIYDIFSENLLTSLSQYAIL